MSFEDGMMVTALYAGKPAPVNEAQGDAETRSAGPVPENGIGPALPVEKKTAFYI